MVEAELSRALHEYYLVVQVLENLTIHKLGSGTEEMLFGNVDGVFLRAYLFADAYKFFHTTLLGEC